MKTQTMLELPPTNATSVIVPNEGVKNMTINY